ncbi:MAG TPA: hypothetical protein DCL08_07695 [Anaerolineaceae bacterium]|jgi:hypothetical protein|nr:MAG: putative membrane protein [Anaerolineaceae bacterium 46_22]HAF49104.1 hypothetical protein [Anaerolineaceae bacterium]
MKFENKPIFHKLVLSGAFITAIVLRLLRLGAMPLTDMEASIALQALAVGQKTETIFGGHMTYVGLTGIDFFLLHTGNFLARFWPALFGALIVFVPFLFRNYIGNLPANILSFILALSPEMVGLSRMIGSPMIAFVLLLLTLGLINQKKPILSGVSFALALMGGSGFWTGIVLVGLSLLTAKAVLQIPFEGFFGEFFKHKDDRLKFLIAFGLTIVLVATGFSLATEGLSGVFSGAVDFVRGFGMPYIEPFVLKPLALAAYSLPAVIFGLWGGIQGLIKRSKPDIFLLITALAGFIYLLLYPNASPTDIIWVSLPLWTLSARVIAAVWRWPEENQFVMIITSVMVVIVFAFTLLAMRSLVSPTINQEARLTTFIALAGGFVLMIALVLLVTYGWSEDVALPGLLMGLSVVVLLGMLSLTVRTTSISLERTHELWHPQESSLSTQWLKVSLDRVLEWNKRTTMPIEIAVADFDTPGMRWVLRDYENVVFVPYVPPSSQPGILISDILTQPEISNSYRGQDLVWSQTPNWQGMTPFQYLSWLMTRDTPETTREIIFWVRTDLMPDEQFAQ